MNMMRKLLIRHHRLLLWTLLGAAAGLAWSRFFGCAGGACALLADLRFTAAYGSVLGALLSQVFRRAPDKTGEGADRP